MGARRIAAAALSGALIAGGTGVAIAAATKQDRGKKTEQAIIDGAAQRLDVTPEKLRDALSAAEEAQLDQAVKDGDLTQKQADAIKQARKDSGRVLGGPLLRGGGTGPGGVLRLHRRGGPGPWPGPGPGGPGMRAFGPGLFDELAKAAGTSSDKLSAALRDGKSLADVAKANGKSVADVRTAVKAAVKTKLDKAVKDGDLTQKQADRMLDHAGDHIDAIVSGKVLKLRGGHMRRGMRPAPDLKPGGFAPGAGSAAPLTID